MAKFATGGKPAAKKDLALMVMTYGHVYVARVAMGGNDAQTVQAFREAEAYGGHRSSWPTATASRTATICASGWINKGRCVPATGPSSATIPTWRRRAEPLQLDSKPPSMPLKKYAYNETRYSMLAHSNLKAAAELERAQQDLLARWRLYEHWASMPVADGGPEEHHA